HFAFGRGRTRERQTAKFPRESVDEVVVICLAIAEQIILLHVGGGAFAGTYLAPEKRRAHARDLAPAHPAQLALMLRVLLENPSAVKHADAMLVFAVVGSQELGPKVVHFGEAAVQLLAADIEGEIAAPHAAHQP